MTMPGILGNGRWRGLAIVTLLTLAQGVAAGAAAFATRGLFNMLSAGTPLSHGLIAMLIASGLVIALARIAARLTGERLGQAYALSVRLALLSHAAGMPASAVAARRGGYMSLRFVGDMTAFRNWLGKGLAQVVAGAVMIPATIFILWWLDPAFALGVSPLFAVTLALLLLAGPRLAPLHRRLRARRARIAAEMAERMPLAPELDRLGRRPAELRNLRRNTKRMIRAGLQRLFWAETLKAIPDVLAGLAAAVIITIGAAMETGTGAIAGALAVVGLLITPLRDLASVWNFRAAYLAAREKCTAALARPQRGLYAGDERLPAAPISVRVSDLSMPRDNPLSFEVAAGAIGVSPCDTHDADLLFAALCGLEDVPADRILLSGLCLTRLSRGSLRRGVARLEARPVVLRGTLRQNLTLGLRQEPSDRRLGKQARRAGLGPLMKRIGGLDGILAEDARNLSDHERSALALARILLSKPGLVLVGTALLHLDTAARDAFWAHVGALGSTILQHPDLQEVRNTGRVIPARVPPDA